VSKGSSRSPDHRRRGREAPVYSDSGIVLRSHKLGESDKVLRILTREHGKRSAVAKGIRKTTSRFGARLEPLTCATLLMHSGRNMDIIKQAEIQCSSREVREDLDLFLRGAAMAEIVDCVTEEHEPHPELFDLLVKGLAILRDCRGRPTFLLTFFEFRVLAIAGFELRVTCCAGCGNDLGAGEAFFSLHMGGFVCDACRGDRTGEVGKLVRVGHETARVLSWMADHDIGEWPDEMPGPGAERELYFLMNRVIEHWMERQFPAHRVMRDVSRMLGTNKAGG